jgi:tRNA(fMet)-specific endonuclease VapC
MYLLDTCVISDFVKGEKGTLAKIKNCSPQELAVSSITIMEINYGFLLNPNKAKKIEPIINELLKVINLINFSNQEAIFTSQIRVFLRKNGTPIGAYDVLIGATAPTQGLILVTANTKEFERIPDLQVCNWRDN